MPIEMPRGVPFSVDTWTPSSKRKRHHFLTHSHKDRSQGISTHHSYPIYATQLTKTLTLQHYPQLYDSLFVGIEVGQSVVIDDPYGAFTVTAFDANHCPGAVMFLFEGNFGSILHTGDSRLTPECLQSLPEKYLGKTAREPRCRLDYVFLDCTFGRFSLKMPSKYSAIQQVINCIWKHPSTPVVYLTCDLVGHEEILVNVYQTFGSKIYIDEESNPDCFQALTLTVPEILSRDTSSRFHVLDGFPKLYERAEAKLVEARANLQPEPLIIRPSAQWYACEVGGSLKQRKERFNEAVRDQFGVWHVCYSTHSSREELECALQLLAPRRVVSTTPTSCCAMELDYVKSHCFYNQLAFDDPLWKLLDIDNNNDNNYNNTVVAPSAAKGVSVSSSCSPVAETYAAEPQLQPLNISTSWREQLLNISPPSKGAPPLTLFGRARLGLQDSSVLNEKKEIMVSCINDDHHRSCTVAKITEEEEDKDDVFEEECGKSLDKNGIEIKSGESVETSKRENGKRSANGSTSKSFNKNMRKLYRSMNVAVPQPLPSLVELMHNARKRSFQF